MALSQAVAPFLDILAVFRHIYFVGLDVKLLERTGILRYVLWERDRDNTTGADPGFRKRGGPIYLMWPNILACLKSGAGVLHACQPSVIRTETTSF